MKDEQELLSKVHKDNPFTVPEKYFENIIPDIMNKIQEKELPDCHTNIWERVKPWIYMAAMFAGLMLSIRIFIGTPTDMELQGIDTVPISDLPDEYLDPIISQTMMDDYELYEYLTDAELYIHN